MKYLFLVISAGLLFSCSDSFINHTLKYEKLGDCAGFSRTIKVLSNINGNRYEFFNCMDDGFNGTNYTVTRKGDSIMVTFSKTAAQKQALFKLTLDVDAKPGYRHMILDDREVNFKPVEN